MQPLTEVIIGDKTVKYLIDSGAGVNVIDSGSFNHLANIPLLQYRLKLWDHLLGFCLSRTAVLICSFTWGKPHLTALKTTVKGRMLLGLNRLLLALCSSSLSDNRQTFELRCDKVHTEIFERTLHWKLYRSGGK